MANNHWENLENLIIVAGHAVYTADSFKNPADDANWFLEKYQKGEPPFYIEHINKGVELAEKDSKALLVFSGGQTRYEAGPKSEAQGYLMIADHFGWWGKPSVKTRAITEEFARDSFENLLFGICRFSEAIGRYPKKTTLVSWKFKEKRFKLHASALKLRNFKFIGPNNPIDLKSAKAGEEKALADFNQDKYGTRTNNGEIENGKPKEFLGDKRNNRNPFNRHHPYLTTCPEIADLLNYTDQGILPKKLPWE